ncbi:aldo/keto reductase, partial [Xanthomonas oryzae pv. oryzae]
AQQLIYGTHHVQLRCLITTEQP